MNWIKRLWNYFTTYEKIWYASTILAMTLLIIFCFEDVLEIEEGSRFIVLLAICSIIDIISSITCELLISKQSRWNFIVSLALVQTSEFIIFLINGQWAMAVVSLVYWGIVSTISFINWTKHKDHLQEELTKVRKFTVKQNIFIVLAIIAFTVVGGFLLSFIPGEEEQYLDAGLTAFAMTNGLLILYRFREQFIVWFLYNLCEAILWIVSGQYILLVKNVAILINSTYGFIKWTIYIKTHKRESTKLSFIDHAYNEDEDEDIANQEKNNTTTTTNTTTPTQTNTNSKTNITTNPTDTKQLEKTNLKEISNKEKSKHNASLKKTSSNSSKKLKK